MATPSFSRTELSTDVQTLVSGEYSSTDFNTIANRSVKEVVSEIDLRSTKRKTALSPNLMDDIYDYSAPSDLKGLKIIDIKPQINRGKYDDWSLVDTEEFDRLKNNYRVDKYGDPINVRGVELSGDNLVTVDERDFIKKIRLSKPVDDTETVVSTLDAVGDWEAFGDGTNITADSENYVKGSASLNWDINADGGTTAGIQNASLDEFDVSDYLTVGYAFVWAYISSTTNLTNFILRVGSDSSNYYYITITTNNEGNSFHAGWNLLRFGFANKSTTGTPDDDACDYVVLYMTKDAAKTSETDYRFDHIILKLGDHYDTYYYSKYGWQSSTGTYLEDSTADTDLLNADVDEYHLFVLRTAINLERNLRTPNMDRLKELKQEYVEAKAEYIQKNPSEALLMTQTYHFL